MTLPRTPARKLDRWTRRCDTIENLAAELNDAAPTLLAASNYLNVDAWPATTIGSETHAEGDHADPTQLAALAALEPAQRDAIAEHLREINSVTAEILGHLRRIARLKDIVVNRKDQRVYATGGDCKCCFRYVSGSRDDRLRALYCQACYTAWVRYRTAANERGDEAVHHRFETTRRAQLDREEEERRKREGAA